MRKTFVALLFLCSINGFSQNRINDHNTIGWYAFFLTAKISGKVSAHVEYQWRRTNFVEGWQQSLPRIGLNYKINANVTTQAGYAWIFTYPYGEHTIASVAKTFPEHRAYEQVTITAPVGKTSLSNRLRLEQRWIGRFNSIESEKPDKYVYVNRVRYMPRLDIPLQKDKKLYFAAFDEILIGFGKNVGENVFDQNRIALLLGYRFNPSLRIEGGYINQVVQLGREIDNKSVFQHNNGIVINTYFNIN
ncbi:MAG TPA: DUF2490 domain-containing protein [Panacibacter sp.]|nr:DUF2490 domain-containing protein [Panacibacter sp.]HNP44177.1 DUF2490 domain-containing protein [Panacibacter sp.]